MAFFLISIMVSGILDQLQTFWQLYVMKLLGILLGLGLLKLWHLICLKISSLMEVLVSYPTDESKKVITKFEHVI